MRPIRITGDPVLHRRAEPVGEVDDAVRALVADMVETMHEAPGVGLAAPQVGESLRLFVWHWVDPDGTLHEGVAVDPELWVSPLRLDELDLDAEEEGCLSAPGERFPLRRADRALLRARDLDGTPFEIAAEGWLARIFQHEFDHLDGVLYLDRLAHPHEKAAAKAVRRHSWGVPGLSWMPGVDDLEG